MIANDSLQRAEKSTASMALFYPRVRGPYCFKRSRGELDVSRIRGSDSTRSPAAQPPGVKEGAQELGPRSGAGDRWSRVVPYIAVGAYAGLIAFVIAHHEPWFDEAQAWLIARDRDLIDLFQTVRYEGQPGLWHLLLMVPAKSLPYQTVNWFSGALGALGVYVFARNAPFPAAVKLAVPFTYFVFYQYGVVARNYALLPVTLFAVAACYPQRHERPVRYALLLFALAATSAHGFLIATVMASTQGLETLSRARKGSLRLNRHQPLSIVFLGLSMALLALSLVPPADKSFPAMTKRPGDIRALVEMGIPMLNGSMAGELPVLAVALLASAWFFWRTRVLHLYALTTLLLLAFFAFIYAAPWHEGVLFLVWVFTLWLGLQRLPQSRWDKVSRHAALAVLTVVCLVQSSWTFRTAVMDVRAPYSGSKELAAYLRENDITAYSIFAIDWPSIAVNPYFDGNIYSNYRPAGGVSYWLWSTKNPIVQDFGKIEELQPDFVVYPIKSAGSEKPVLSSLTSYRPRAVFAGGLFWKGAVHEPDTYLLLERMR